ncbi:FAD/NAD(P)-binding domain-containing protein [Teratosphaeria destructans]|uniref:FAD/NAD(P)-binding domain-containing protein n=1 Tax=Teratosphaeria destructans TaxID=418781 RepID=A0A9W7SU11_9PEZI|nr:FAD/NAD(P)-binding domain-containing protein [Teratosphaeria destructans]
MTLQQDTYHDRQVTVLAVNSVLVVLSVGAVALRFWARRLRQVGLYVDDYLIVAGLLFALGVNALLYAALWAGLGKHVRNLSRNTVQGYALNLFAIELFWNTTMPVIKFSILIFLKRLFPVGFVKPICNAIMVFLALWFLAFQFTTIFQCRPIHQAWMHTDISRCVSFVVFGAAAAGTNTLTDVILLVLPMTQIWKLQMKVDKKIGSSCIFALGFV